MRVLVACEFSGRVRTAFMRAGHNAMSCDFLPTELDGPHYQGDVFDVIDDGWDLMVAHPPCTYLANSGVRWLGKDAERWALMREGATFFKKLLNARIPHIAIENPIMHGHASKIIGRRQDQIIQPWQFSHLETKATCLWLVGLPRLIPTSDLKDEMLALPIKERERVAYVAPGPDRWKIRSLTYQGIASAMGEQWTEDAIMSIR